MRILGLVLIVAALVAGIAPQFLDCESFGRNLTLADGKTIVPMKCHWTAMAEIALAVPLAGMGAIIASGRRKASYRDLGIVSGIIGVFIAAVPLALIGVCANKMMMCNMVMQPLLAMTGIVAVAASLAIVAANWRPTAGRPQTMAGLPA